ncbi:Uncharacterised protein [Candidatus Gugararchaeum adminiculabundum]|nr:Uncharacterised protein [Candidatus Gugararchaeum adminiculabundum]
MNDNGAKTCEKVCSTSKSATGSSGGESTPTATVSDSSINSQCKEKCANQGNANDCYNTCVDSNTKRVEPAATSSGGSLVSAITSISYDEYGQCKEKCAKEKDANDCISKNCVQWSKTAVIVSDPVATAVSEDPIYSCVKKSCPADTSSVDYATCKEKCYSSIYGKTNCKQFCEGETSAEQKCTYYCAVESTTTSATAIASATTSVETPITVSTDSGGSSVSTQIVDKLGECISYCKKGGDEKSYAICKQKCIDVHQYDQACKKACQKLDDGTEKCSEICPGEIVSVDNQPQVTISVATTSGDKLWDCVSSYCPKAADDASGYGVCKEKCYNLVFGDQNCKEDCSAADENGTKVCKKYCDVASGEVSTTATASVPTTIDVPTEMDPVIKCVLDRCKQANENLSSTSDSATASMDDYAKCKEECYKEFSTAPVAAVINDVCSGDNSNLTSGSQMECMKMVKVKELKSQCENLTGTPRADCEHKVNAIIASEDVGDYKNWLSGYANSASTSETDAAKKVETDKAKANFDAKVAEQNQVSAEDSKQAMAKLEAFAKKAIQRQEKFKTAIGRAKAKGHDTTELEYLSDKYSSQLNSAKELYLAGQTTAALEALRQSDQTAAAFKETLKQIVAENNVGLKHKASDVSPLASTMATETANSAAN